MLGKKHIPKKDTDEIFNIPPYLINPNPELSRTEFVDMSLCSLADSISRYGILQPLAVRISKRGSYELVAGERRLRAAVMLKLPTVPCVLLKDSEKCEYLSVIENIQREKLGMFDEARAVKRLLARNGGSVEKTASLLSMSESDVRSKIRLCEYSRAEMQALSRLCIGERTAVLLLDIPQSVRFYAIKLCAEYKLGEDSVSKLCTEISKNKELCREELEAALLSIASERNGESHDRCEKGQEHSSEPAKAKVLLRDLRLFENSLERSVEILRNASYTASLEACESDEGKVYTVRVSRNGKKEA